jgi:hypothetical protein
VLSTSNEYKNTISESRIFHVTAEITLKDSTILTIDNTQIVEGGIKIDDGVSQRGQFTIGSAIIGQLTLKLNNLNGEFNQYDFTDAIIRPSIGLELSESIETLNKGVYTVDSTKFIGSTIILTALDNMAKFDTPFKDVNITFPATTLKILQAITLHCGVFLETVSFMNNDLEITDRPEDTALTCREMVSYIGQISGNFARINHNGGLELKWYEFELFDEEPPDPNSIHHFTVLSNVEIAMEDVVITGIQVLTNDEDTEPSFFGVEGYVVSIENNPLIDSSTIGQLVANSVGAKIVGMRFRPMELSILSDPSVEAGDVALVTDRKGNTYQTLVSNLTFSIGNYEDITCDAETPSWNSATRYSEATKTIVEARKKIKQELTYFDLAVQQLNDLLTHGFGVYKSSETLEDGSIIYYMHDKPTLGESTIIWKQTAEVFAVSTDGGETYQAGFDANGNAVINVLNAIGVVADWVKTGTIQSQDGNTWINLDTGYFNLGNVIYDSEGFKITVGGESLEEALINLGSEIERIQGGGGNLLLNSNYGTFESPDDYWWSTGVTWLLYENRIKDWDMHEDLISSWNDFENYNW